MDDGVDRWRHHVPRSAMWAGCWMSEWDWIYCGWFSAPAELSDQADTCKETATQIRWIYGNRATPSNRNVEYRDLTGVGSNGRCTNLYWLVHDRYSTFLLFSVSSPSLLLTVSLTRHFLLLAITQRFLYSTYPMKGITCIFTQTFHYPRFQLLDVSALPNISPSLWHTICATLITPSVTFQTISTNGWFARKDNNLVQFDATNDSIQ